jgi:hypothetical protein
MASELRVNTLKDASGNNSVGMSYVAEGTAKSWSLINGTGTIAVRDTFNVASITDGGTGYYRNNLTSSMSTVNYTCIGGVRNSSDGDCFWQSLNDLNATSHYQSYSMQSDTTAKDAQYLNASIEGDLA